MTILNIRLCRTYLSGFLLTFFFHLPALPLSLNILPNHNKISFDGVLFIKKNDTLVTFTRLTDKVISDPESKINAGTAASQTGIIVRFRTASDTIHASFVKLRGIDMGCDFGIYQDGVFRTNSNTVAFDIISYNPGKVVTYEIVLPSLYNVGFKGLKLCSGDSLLTDIQPRKPRCITIGNSITHGNGQGSASYKTYPFLLCRLAGWELVNLGVGASWVSPALGAMFPDARPDIITILWGYNDWNKVNDLPVFRGKYEKLLTNIRNDHPTVPNYCITYIHHNKPADVNNGYSLDDFRTAVRDIVNARVTTGDKNLFVLNGEKLTSAQDLKDSTHLNVAGAARFAGSLYNYIGKALNPPVNVVPPPKQESHSSVNQDLQDIYDLFGRRIQRGKTTYQVIHVGDIKRGELCSLPNGIYFHGSAAGRKTLSRLMVVR